MFISFSPLCMCKLLPITCPMLGTCMVITCHMHVHVQMHMCLCLYTYRDGLLWIMHNWPTWARTDKHAMCTHVHVHAFGACCWRHSFVLRTYVGSAVCSCATCGLLCFCVCVCTCVCVCVCVFLYAYLQDRQGKGLSFDILHCSSTLCMCIPSTMESDVIAE